MTSASTSPIRTRSFAEILDDVALASEERDARAQHFASASGQDWLFSLLGGNAAAVAPADAGFDAAFFVEADESLPDELSEPEVSEPAVSSFDLDEDKIAAELGLAAVRSVADLARARRAFALRNHPDLFHQAVRDQANARMQLANMLLDRRRKEIKAGR